MSEKSKEPNSLWIINNKPAARDLTWGNLPHLNNKGLTESNRLSAGFDVSLNHISSEKFNCHCFSTFGYERSCRNEASCDHIV